MNATSKQYDFRYLVSVGLLAVLLMIMVSVPGCSALKDRDVSNNSDYVVLEDIPDWDGSERHPYIEINGNVPEFEKEEIDWAERAAAADAKQDDAEYEVFGDLDRKGRCGSAIACVGRKTMPEGERGPIGMVRPSGWQLDKYDFIDNGGYLYNRCHLIGWQLTGQNEEERNLITGTRYMNTAGMLPFENEVAEYVRSTDNHVLYRVTPIFKGKELLARGVEMEAYSLEDKGASVSFNVFCYNVQPGVSIDYRTGENELDESTMPAATSESVPDLDVPDGVTYILNTNTMRFHSIDCKGARTIREYNREWFYGTRDEAMEKGFIPCGMCQP